VIQELRPNNVSQISSLVNQTVLQLKFGNQSGGERAKKEIIVVFSLFNSSFGPKVGDFSKRNLKKLIVTQSESGF